MLFLSFLFVFFYLFFTLSILVLNFHIQYILSFTPFHVFLLFLIFCSFLLLPIYQSKIFTYNTILFIVTLFLKFFLFCSCYYFICHPFNISVKIHFQHHYSFTLFSCSFFFIFAFFYLLFFNIFLFNFFPSYILNFYFFTFNIIF